MMVIGPATGATQGKLAQSILSTSINYGVKEKTGKYPYEHIIKRERDKEGAENLLEMAKRQIFKYLNINI